MEGEQYELWEVDESPTQFQQPAAQKQIPINCWLCDTLMYALREQVGTELTCPDCGSRTGVKLPEERKPARSVLVADGTEYEASPPRVMSAAVPVLDPEHERRILAEDEAGRGGSIHDTEKQRLAKRKRKLDAHGRPIRPRWPTITGVVPFLWSPGVIPRYCVLLVAGTITGFALLFTLGMLTGMAILGVFLLAGVAVVSFIFLAAIAAHFMAIVVESSDGSDEVVGWPPANFADWLPETIYIAVAVTVAAAPGWVVARLAGCSALELALWAAVSWLLFFPLVLLSQLDIGSPAAVLSGKMLASYGRVPGTWFLFLVESVLLWAACEGIFAAAIVIHPAILFLVPPMVVLAGILYARLVGRLAWAIAEATPAAEFRDRDAL
jgi:hypothetical protein